MKARPPVARRRGCWNSLGRRLAVFTNLFPAAAAAITATGASSPLRALFSSAAFPTEGDSACVFRALNFKPNPQNKPTMRLCA